MRLHLNVTIRPDSREEPERRPIAGGRTFRRALSLDRRLARHTPQLLVWAKRSTENMKLLLIDPVSAVARAGVKLPIADQRALKQRVDALLPRDVLPGGVELVGLSVSIASGKRSGASEAVQPARKDHAGSGPSKGRQAKKKGGGRE